MKVTTTRELQAVAIALLVLVALGSLLMLAVGQQPGHVWWAMLERTGSDPYAVGQVLYKATALTLTGLAFSLAYDAGLFNIGAEGQALVGVGVCASIGAALPEGTPAIVAIPLCLFGAAAGGAVIGAGIGAMRVLRGVHEILSAIMLNAIVAGAMLYLGNEYIYVGGAARGPTIQSGAVLPQLGFSGSAVNAAVFITIAVVVLVWFLRSRTAWGQAWRATGRDDAAARTVGIDVERVKMFIMAACGALAGLTAATFVLGHKHAYEEGLGRGYGFLGIAAALLGRNHPVGVGVAALFLSFLSTAGLKVGEIVPKELTEMLLGIVVLAVAAAGPWVRRNSKEQLA